MQLQRGRQITSRISTGAVVALVIACALAWSPAADAEALPYGFVHLRQIDPTIRQDIRYAGERNFVGRRIAGYEAAECILVERAALALKRAQSLLAPGLSLVVFDCYRPAGAVADFLAWSRDGRDPPTKSEYFPIYDKAQLFGLGYIAQRSGHSRGTSVDLALVRVGPKRHHAPNDDIKAGHGNPRGCHLPGASADDAMLDFGTAFDCFHPASQTVSPDVSEDAQRNRAHLSALMRAVGFKNYWREWWHFELAVKPGNATHDFPVK